MIISILNDDLEKTAERDKMMELFLPTDNIKTNILRHKQDIFKTRQTTLYMETYMKREISRHIIDNLPVS